MRSGGPIVGARLWRAVVGAAGGRCECTGTCGKAHAKGDDRCPAEHGKYLSKRHGPVRLVAAPSDPTTPMPSAAELPANALRAWCGNCLDTARRNAARAARSVPDPGQGELFDL